MQMPYGPNLLQQDFIANSMTPKKKFSELTDAEVQLRNLIYAIESKDQVVASHPFPMGEAYLQHKLAEAKEVAEQLGIELVKIEK